jgi:hemerythrin-like domain-containing protein
MSAAPAPPAEPIAGFSRCHDGILAHLEALGSLPTLLDPAARARQVAEEAVRFFRSAVYEHHREEERELFPAVLASAAPGAEHDRVQTLVRQLTQEHREVESQFERLEPALKKVAKGHDPEVDGNELAADIQRLVLRYAGHARYEENDFLPLAERILGRNSNHMAALGLSIHLRHTLPDVLQRYGSRI